MSLTDVFQVQIETLVDDRACKIDLYYRRSSGGPAGFPAKDLVDTVFAEVWPALQPILATTVQLMRIIGRPLDGASGAPYEANFDETVKGTGTGADPLPPSIALLIKLICTSSFSKNNGHVYIAGVSEADWLDGVWEPATFVPLVATLASILKTARGPSAGAVQYNPCVVSRYLANVKRVPPVTFDVVSASMQPLVSQQRRRQSQKQGIKT